MSPKDMIALADEGGLAPPLSSTQHVVGRKMAAALRAIAEQMQAAEPAALDELVGHFCYAVDNLGDMPISDAWADKWEKKARQMLFDNNFYAAWRTPPYAHPSPDTLRRVAEAIRQQCEVAIKAARRERSVDTDYGKGHYAGMADAEMRVLAVDIAAIIASVTGAKT